MENKKFWKVQYDMDIWEYFHYGRDNERRLDLHHELVEEASSKPNVINLQIGVHHNKNEKHGKNWLAVDLFDKRDCIDYNMDLSDLKFPGDMFNFIECNAILEHVKQPWLCAAELYRVCKQGGHIWVEAPYMQRYHPFKNYNEEKHGIIAGIQNGLSGDNEHGGHYFNFTPQGLVEILKPFKMKEVLLLDEGGVGYYGIK
jgi:hypothetical protein